MATASQSLFNITVPADSTQSSQGLLMPKLQYRFRALFLNFGVNGNTTEITKQVMDIKRPSLSFDEIGLDIYNSKVYILGKPQWQETSVNVRDDAAGNVAKLVGQQVQKQFDFVEQASAATGQDYKFQLTYEVLDGGNGNLTPTVLESWELYGCMVKSVDWGAMNYATNEPATIAMTIRFDNAVQSPLTSGVGTSVGRAFGGSTVTGIGQ